MAIEDLFRGDYETAQPFPHIVLDNFWDPADLRAAADSIAQISDSLWQQHDHHAQQRKRWISIPQLLPDPLETILLTFNQREAIGFIEKITGISGLLPDPSYLGGGLHRVDSGGRLAIHADFNVHPDLGLHRRVNALLFFNPRWQKEWGGELEMWAPDMSRCVQSYEPKFNRLVIFSTTDKALHGHPEPLRCPDNESRLALALYYYTKSRPLSEQGPFHWADWKLRPNGEV